MFRNAVAATLAVAFGAMLGVAQTPPNFSGVWKLNVAKSDFGPMPGPSARMDRIEQTAGSLKDSIKEEGGPQGDRSYTMVYTLDGTESVNNPGIEMRSTAKWTGAALGVITKLKFQDQDVTLRGNWTMSDDGKVLTLNQHLESAMGEADQKFTFDRQDSGAGASMPASTATPAATASIPPATPRTSSGSASASATARPNYSGTWVLNAAKSDFGPLPGPDKQTETIDHKEPFVTIKVHSEGPQGPQDYTIATSTDGKEMTTKFGPQDVKVTTAWEGPNLSSLVKLKFQDQDVSIKSTYVLSPDGKTLTVNAHLESAMGEADQKMVFDRVS